jgi:hypothetical protein
MGFFDICVTVAGTFREILAAVSLTRALRVK